MLVSLILAIALAVDSHAQVLRVDNVDKLNALLPDSTALANDYFSVNTEAPVRDRLASVENHHMGRGLIEKIAKGEYKYALQELDFILTYFPNHPTGLQLLMSVAALSKNRALPIPFFEKAIALYPNRAITYAQYGWYYVTIDRLDIGIHKLQHAIEMEPQLTAAHVWLAKAYEKKGDSQLAREAAKRAKELGYNEKLPGYPGR
jgi:predicted Zn-dependent protease